jgi:hypothetical protein
MRLMKPFMHAVKEERGAVLLTTLFFLFCLCGLLSLLLFIEQAAFLQMKTQQTADIVTKGARTAGKWTYFDSSGDKREILFATTREARQRKAEIIRGAREEAAILWSLNEPGLEKNVEKLSVIHQKGERKSLYKQGIYHLRVTVKSRIELLGESVRVIFERVSQSGLR